MEPRIETVALGDNVTDPDMHAPQLALRTERVTRPHMLIEQGALLAQSQALRNDGYDRSPTFHYLLESMGHVQSPRHR